MKCVSEPSKFFQYPRHILILTSVLRFQGLFCPFAHRANLALHLKQLDKYAGIETSIVKPYPKGDENGWPGWQFNVKGEEAYEGATEDKLFGSK